MSPRIAEIVHEQGDVPMRSSYGLLLRLGRARVVLVVTMLTILASCAITALMVLWSINARAAIDIPGLWRWSLATAVVVPAILSPLIVLVMMDMLSHLERSLRATDALAHTDALTGLRNRRSFLRDAERLLREAAGSDRQTWLLMVDIDDFKRINDTHGHIAGDTTLVAVASICGEAASSDDLCARFGGEEFALLLRHGDRARAFSVAETIRVRIENAHRSAPSGMQFPLGVSIGCAEGDEVDHALTALLALADERLYQAKRAGKNRVMAGGEA